MPNVDFDALDLPGTGTLPVGTDDGARYGGIRNRQQPRHPLTTTNESRADPS
jgi:hypothetical protein